MPGAKITSKGQVTVPKAIATNWVSTPATESPSASRTTARCW